MNITTTANDYNMFYMKSQHSIYLIFLKKAGSPEEKKAKPALKNQTLKR